MAHDVFEGAGPLHAVFHPASVAVIGASTEPHTLGHKVFSGLLNNSFGFPVYRALDDAPAPVDLAVVVTTGDDALDAIERCAAAGVNGVVVMSGADGSPERRRDFERRVGELLHKSRTKLIGPRCFALMNPSVGLNVSPGLPMPVAGNVAFIAQSSSLATTIIDWSHKGIVGFSAFVALGDMLDVGWGNLIDYFGADWATRAICIHMESIVNMRSFLSAARAVASQKPIIVIKAGRSEAAATAFSWHHNCHVSDDEVFDAALRRVGVIRVDSIEDLFDVADALSKQPRPVGRRLTVVTNAGGPGVLAADHVVESGTLVKTGDPSGGPANVSAPAPGAPSFDVLGDGSSQPFLQAVEEAAQNPASDALLLLLVPQAMSDPARALHGLLTMGFRNKPALLCLPSPPALPVEQEALVRACFPVYSSTTEAARTFNYMWHYSHDLQSIYETPELHADAADRDLKQQAGDLIARARSADRDDLSDAESRGVLASYGISTRRFEQAPDDGCELRIGSRVDPEFGPVVWLGAGGRAADLISGKVIGLPPLNATLARRMLERSPLFPGLQRLASRGAVNLGAIDAALVRLSQLVVEQPAIREVSIDPLLSTAEGTFAVGAYIALYRSEVPEPNIPPPVFRPFPVQYVSSWTTRQGEALTIRPIRPEDEPLMVDFHGGLSENAVYLRYFQVVKLARRTAHEVLTRVCFVDYDREMVLVAERRGAVRTERQIVAIASLTKLSTTDGEVAVLIADDYQRHGLGTELVRRLVQVARDEHLERVLASTMTDNHGMCRVFRRLGFALSMDNDEVRVELDLR